MAEWKRRNRRRNTSKLLSYVLRHCPETMGIQLDGSGWADVAELLVALERHGKPLTREELEEVVATNNKQRFAFSEDGQRIRASQGHSIPVDLGLKPLAPPRALYHGTAESKLDGILREGLTRGNRNHVHLSPDAETAIKVGRRHGKPVVLEIHAAKMDAEGFKFYLSDNGIWLTDHVPVKYLVPPDR